MEFPLPGWPLFRLGFRPFYLGAAAFAALAVPYWVAALLGVAALPATMPPLLWHAHEMLFGFAVAVIVGFLLTAGKAWTGLATPRGAFLGALAALWSAARIAAVMGPYALYAVLDLLLLPVVAAVIVDVLVRARNRRNLPLAGILLLLSLVNACFHLAAIGVIGMSPLHALHAALALIVMIECLIAGRVVPAFTINATPGLRLVVRPRVEQITLALTAFALLCWVVEAPPGLTATALGLAAAAHLRRQWSWRPWVTRSRPILWILHAAYAWLPLGLALKSAWLLGGLEVGRYWLHALGAGTIATMVFAVITRVALGHSGRPLVVRPSIAAAYVLLHLGALLRVVGPAMFPEDYERVLAAAAIAWTLAFLCFLVVYAPILVSRRPDGKPG